MSVHITLKNAKNLLEDCSFDKIIQRDRFVSYLKGDKRGKVCRENSRMVKTKTN